MAMDSFTHRKSPSGGVSHHVFLQLVQLAMLNCPRFAVQIAHYASGAAACAVSRLKDFDGAFQIIAAKG